MIKPKLLHNYLQSDEAYSKQYDDIVKKETDWWEEQMNHHALYPTDEDLKKTREAIEKNHKEKPITDDDIKDAHHRLFTLGAIATKMGIKKTWEGKRVKTIAEWKKDARQTNKRILGAIPFDNIKCKKCNILLNYRWSMLHEETAKNISKVLFFYYCPNECGNNQLIFADGTPWISESDNTCAVCKGERNSTVTKDNAGNSYIIFECKKCGSRQVEKYELQAR